MMSGSPSSESIEWIDVDRSTRALEELRAKTEDTRVALDRALETFSTRLLNVKDANAVEVRRVTELAKEARRQADRMCEAAETRARAMETRLEEIERRLETLSERSANAGEDSACKLHAVTWSTRANAAFEEAPEGGAPEDATRSTRLDRRAEAATTIIAAIAGAISRACLAIGCLWLLFYVTVAAAVMWDDRRLARDVFRATESSWLAFTDQILALMT